MGSLDECRTAIQHLHIASTGEWTVPESIYVYGCSIKHTSNNQLHFNTNVDGVARSSETPVCKMTTILDAYTEFGDAAERLSMQPDCHVNEMDHGQCREKSTTVFQPLSSEHSSTFNGLLWSFGQFVDHDLDFVLEDEDEVIVSPFDESNEFTFHRAQSHCADGEHGNYQNSISSRLDLSSVYGATAEREEVLRHPIDRALIKFVGEDELLPHEEEIFCCGDARCAENPFLTSQHVLWLKHHNVLASEIQQTNPELSREEVYEEAKRKNIATYQRIIDKEFLPALVGRIPSYAGVVPQSDWAFESYSSSKINIGLLSLNGGDGDSDISDKVTIELCRDMILSLDVCRKRYISYRANGECVCSTSDEAEFAPSEDSWTTYEINQEWITPTAGDMSISSLFANAAYRLHHLVNDEFNINGRTEVLADHFFSRTSYRDNGKLNGWIARLLK